MRSKMILPSHGYFYSTINKNAVREFDAFINASIRRMCLEAVRKVIGNKKGLVFVPLEEISCGDKERYLSTEDISEEIGGGLYKIRIEELELDTDSRLLKEILEDILTKKEAKTLILTIGEEYSLSETAGYFKITKERVKSHKSYGLKKARRKAGNNGKRR